ncbi:hypothetical protein [Acanthopleuribacter pedis]|uniref:DUF8082 domain-containing protein n=1 Tax=Acanthopleuribacter pedis TaxID=442870 RepID=A0A8J7QIP6_9BACT|nr:hypothetical protein [Acanthopleuribacter pedis]MBO1319028.1 hypothetical protein [Acanthopleuribacter pedis]
MIDFGSIETIPGFRWGFQVGNDGTYQFSATHQNHIDDRRQAEQFYALWQTLPANITLADYSFQNGRVFVRVVAGGIVVLFCDKLVRRSIISTALDALFNHADASTQLTPPLAGRGSGSQVLSAADSGGGNSGTAGSMTRVSFGNGTAPPSTPIPESVVTNLMTYFTEELGPLAPMVARKTCKKAGINLDHLVHGNWTNTLNLLADVIENEEKRERFLDKAVLLRKAF